jgi:DNA-binding PadR family transcriptional regulator
MKYFFLSLLAQTPTHGYDLLQSFEQLFSQALPPLNAGQIYTTLGRLERDGLVRKSEVEQTGKPDKNVYELTPEGRQALLEWFSEPVAGSRLKDNFYLKLVSAGLSDLADPRDLITRQRQQYLQSLHDLNALALQPAMAEETAKGLLIQGMILHLKADLEWLALCEEAFS